MEGFQSELEVFNDHCINISGTCPCIYFIAVAFIRGRYSLILALLRKRNGQVKIIQSPLRTGFTQQPVFSSGIDRALSRISMALLRL